MVKVKSGATVLWACLLVVAATLLTKHAQTATKAVLGGLVLCGHVMIPTLFPFMIVSELLVRSGGGRWLSRFAVPLLSPLLRLSEAGCCSLLLGWLCGFPVGARTAAAYWRAGQMSDAEFGRVVCFCHLPSTAFLVGTVGGSLLGSVAAGRTLLLSAWLCSLGTGLLLTRRAERHAPCLTPTVGVQESGFALLSRSVASAATGMVNVCATVLLFSALVGTLKVYAEAWGLPPMARVLLLGSLEMSTGVFEAVTLTGAGRAFAACAALIGFGGVSVQCQILAVCEGCPVPQRRFWLCRLCQGGACALLAYLCLRLGLCSLPDVLSPSGQRVSTTVWELGREGAMTGAWQLTCAALLLTGLALAHTRAWRAKKGGGESG